MEALKRSLKADDFHHQGEVSSNFLSTLPKGQQALRAIATFKDEYLLVSMKWKLISLKMLLKGL